MATLYELTGDVLQLYEMMEDPEIDEEVLADTLEAVLGEFNCKADAYAKVIKNLEADAEMLKNEIDKLSERKRVAENNINRIKTRLLECMKLAGKDEIEGDLFKIKIRNSGKQLPEDIEDHKDLIPDEYFIPQDPKLDKRSLLADIKAGKVKGIEMRVPQSLNIK